MNLELFWSKTETTKGGCILWRGAMGSNGYGIVAIKVGPGKWQTTSAHRWLWQQLHGRLPSWLVVDHLCGVKICVNPLHLEPVTQSVNLLRERERGGGRCPAGHEYDNANTHVDRKGYRHCRVCDAARHRNRRMKTPDGD